MKNKFDAVLSELESAFPKLKDVLVVYLYGSVARNDYSLRHSDLDLLVVLKSNSVSERMKGHLDKKIIPVGLKRGVKIHIEYQGVKIKLLDQSLLRKVIEEGRIIYSSGIFTYSYDQIGLSQFIVYTYSSNDLMKKSALSKALHGHKSWYYRDKKKIVKEYSGLIDGKTIIALGKGVLMVSKQKQKEMEMLLRNCKADFNIIRIVYS